MSVDHDRMGSLPEAMGRRMRSAWSEATAWFETASTDDGASEPEARSGPAEGTANGTDATEQDAGGSVGREPGPRGTRDAEEIVTPEERVVRLVGEHGGGMRQADIVTAVEWSESTVSRKLSKLESAGTITRYQIGREKLVFLPGNEPESLGSPWREAVADAPQGA